MFKRIFSLLLSITTISLITLGISILGACSNQATNDSQNNKNVGFQLDKPNKDEEIAIMTTSKGIIKLRFFPDEAPKTVENFKGLAKKGYYDNLTFHRIIKDFMIQGGDPKGNGTGGESIWGKPFEDEFSDKLFNVTGSISMANSGPNTNGSQFFINQNPPEKFIGWDKLEQYYKGKINFNLITNDIKNLYNKTGGNPGLDGYCNLQAKGHTVFGQVFEGMDVVATIASEKTDSNNKPLENVTIQSVKIVNYEG